MTWIDAIFAAMPDAPPHLRGELDEATDGHEFARVFSAEQRARRNAGKRRRRREHGHPCACCDAIVTREATHCRTCGPRERARRTA